MLRRILDYQLSMVEKTNFFRFRPLIEAMDNFLYEIPVNTRNAPHIRYAFAIKR